MKLLHLIFLPSVLLEGLVEAHQQQKQPTYKPPLVETSSGKIRGYSPVEGVHAYVGIPYAQPPIGDLRFEAPQPYHASANVFNATERFASCFQVHFWDIISDKTNIPREGEDCLLVNVWKSSQATNTSSLPVVVYLFGGGFSQGGSSETDGNDFVRENPDVLFVDFNYRLNLFGFPNNPSTTKNVGLLDQRFAIKWIHNNIGAFGGDPSRITLMGQSAGSISAELYAYTHASDPLINGLITWIGQPATQGVGDDGTSWKRVIGTLGCNGTNSTAEIACMKRHTGRELRRAINADNYLKYGDYSGSFPFTDNKTFFSQEEYARRGKMGEFAKVPIWAGSMRNEGDGIGSYYPFTNPRGAAAGINYTMSDYITLSLMQCPTSAETSYRFENKIPVYRTVMSATFPEMEPYPWARSYHQFDILLFLSFPQTRAYQDVGPEVLQAGILLRKAVAAFAKDPSNGLKKTMGWPRYDPAQKTLINLFPYNTAEFSLEDPAAYDKPCQSLGKQDV